MKLHPIILALSLCVTITRGEYMSRMALVNRLRPVMERNPAAFRPGVMLQRPWMPHRVSQGQNTQNRQYVVYRQHNPQNRYAVKQYAPTRSVYSAPWRAARPGSTTEKGFIRATTHLNGGGIHTIPAPNLSLKEKPIVVVDATSERPKIFEVTEKYPEHVFQLAKIEHPIGFSKPSSISTPDLQTLVQNGASFQLALNGPDAAFSSISINQPAQFSHNLQPAQFQQSFQQPSSFQHSLQPTSFQHSFQHQALQPTSFQQPLVQQSVLQPVVQQSPLLPQQFQHSVQRINTATNPPVTIANDMIQARPEGIVISPSALYQPDPAFLQKLQNQLLQRFPGIEFVPYVTEFNAPTLTHTGQPENNKQVNRQGQLQAQESQIQIQTVSPQAPINQNLQVEQTTTPLSQTQEQAQSPQTPEPQNQNQPLFLLQNEQITKQAPSSFVTSESQKNIVQRETLEGTVTLVPVTSPANNVTENRVDITTAGSQPNVTAELKADPVLFGTTTIKFLSDSTTADPKTTPIYYAQVGQSIGNIVASGFYSAINDVRSAMQQNDPQTASPQQNNTSLSNVTITASTINPDLQQYFVQKPADKDDNSTAANEIKPLLGVPFKHQDSPLSGAPFKPQDSPLSGAPFKPQDSPLSGAPFKPQDSTLAYTLVRADDKENKIEKDGSIYAGQLVEASVSEDHDFNKGKARFPTRRAPIRLMAKEQNHEISNATSSRGGVIKARIPPRSKLTFDDKTGEPVLRIYASYVDTPQQKEQLASKLASSSSKRVREAVYRKQDPAEWKPDKNNDGQLTHSSFGLKLRSRSDEYLPLFDDYQD